MRTASHLEDMYRTMLDALGPSHWWPGDSPFEMAIGAILTQNTNWANVEKAIRNLKKVNALSPAGLRALPLEQLQECIRPSGYFRMKAGKLHNFLDFLEAEGDGTVESLQGRDLMSLRDQLLTVKGIGPETADCILCYALEQPIMVVDTYTARMMHRHSLIPEEISYSELQDLFMDHLDHDTAMFNEFHALIVRVGKQWCSKKNPQCGDCPLERFLS